MTVSVRDGGIGQPISVLNGEEDHRLISIDFDTSRKPHFHWGVWIRICLPDYPTLIK